MIKVLAKAVVLTVCITQVACTTLRPVNDWQPPATSTQATGTTGLKPGDHITVTTTSQQAELQFTRLTADALEGTVGKDKAVVQIPRAEILHVERKEIDGLKTAGLIGAVALTTLLVIGLSSAAIMPGY
jgi:hypothetical protein